MKFFIPHVAKSDYEAIYTEIVKSIKDQMKTAITPRKIQSISYVHDKKRLKAEVGQPDPQEGRYEVFAILESKPYVVFTRSEDGSPGLNILVSEPEVTEVVEFD